MSISASNIPVWPRRAPVASCLAVALGLCAITASGRDRHGSDLPQGRVAASAPSFVMPSYPTAETPVLVARDSLAGGIDRPASILQVMNCDDSGPGSLRDEIAAAASGATIDLSQLACSTITLGSEIVVAWDTLYLQGPGAAYLSISGNRLSRVLKHTGSGTLNISDPTIAEGHYDPGNAVATGGCIFSQANVTLWNSVIADCTVRTSGYAGGGGVFTAANLELSDSTISHAIAYSSSTWARGGGANVGGYFLSKYSSISDNKSYDNNNYDSSAGGGVLAHYDFLIQGSTISANSSENGGGLFTSTVGTGSVINSTVSSNMATEFGSGVFSSSHLTVRNSTIAFNRTLKAGSGIYSNGATIALGSSIIADNFGLYGAGDIAGSGTLLGDVGSNLIVASWLPPPANTLTDCPKLQPLADNGGVTLTHALAHDSPAIDLGANQSNLVYDQRRAQRVVGAQADIGAVEWQTGEIDERILASGFDGLCDQ